MFNSCLLFGNSKTNNFGIVNMQTNNTLILANIKFVNIKEISLKEVKLMSKPREQLTDHHFVKFNSNIIKLIN